MVGQFPTSALHGQVDSEVLQNALPRSLRCGGATRTIGYTLHDFRRVMWHLPPRPGFQGAITSHKPLRARLNSAQFQFEAGHLGLLEHHLNQSMTFSFSIVPAL